MKRNLSLEGLRGLACLTVVNAHFWFVFLPYVGYFLYPAYEGGIPRYRLDAILSQTPLNIIFNGNLGVCIFFVISGYVLTASYYNQKDSTVLFLGAIKRFPRLVIPAFFSVIFTWAIQHIGMMQNHLAEQFGAAGWVMQHYKEETTFLHAVYVGMIGAPFLGEVYLNTPLWTLNVEIMGSFLLFALYRLFGQNHKILLFLFFLFFSFNLGNLRTYGFHTLGSPLFYLSFVLGSYLNIIERGMAKRQFISGLILILGIVIASIDYSPKFDFINSLQLPNMTPFSIDFNTQKRGFYYTIAALLIVAGILGNRMATAFLSNRVFLYIGKISFSIYLLHWPIICSVSFWVMKKGMIYTNNHFTMMIISFFTTYFIIWIFADLFYRYIEKPSIRFSVWIADAIHSQTLYTQIKDKANIK